MQDATKSGDPCEASRYYRASCGCGHTARILCGTAFPHCPICARPVVWFRTEAAWAGARLPPRALTKNRFR